MTVVLCLPVSLRAAEPPDINAAAAVLIEAETGMVVFGKYERSRMFPAGLTMVLTALVVLDHFDPDEVVVAGQEIRSVMGDAALANHVIGEHITVRNLLRACFYLSANDSANILAMNVAKRDLGEETLPFNAAERHFSRLMNEKAHELGAVNSNFLNPHGYHHNNHFSTPYDMALICREALNNDIIRQISAETRWQGNGAGPSPEPGWTTRQYSFTSRNELILPGGEYFYPYAIGMRTGRTTPAGDTLASAAMKDGVELVAVISNSRDPGRWQDAALLFDYGFDNFSHVTVMNEGDTVGKIEMQNPRKQDGGAMQILATESLTLFLSQNRLSEMRGELAFLPDAVYESDTAILLRTPIEEGQILGLITYYIGDEILYSGEFAAMRGAETRSVFTDIDYYWELTVNIFFVREAVPYWIIAGLSLIIVSYVVFRVVRRVKIYNRRFY
jgi:D-alanyl-D-alanine carboxypeptidase (penicillin-binding protein 5/6)